MRKLLNGLLVSGLLAAAGHARAADLPILTQHLLSEHAEVEAAQAAIDFCAAKKVGIHVVIVDSDGNVKLLRFGSTVIGAIGVGGGAPSQDQQCADAGVAKIELLLR